MFLTKSEIELLHKFFSLFDETTNSVWVEQGNKELRAYFENLHGIKWIPLSHDEPELKSILKKLKDKKQESNKLQSSNVKSKHSLERWVALYEDSYRLFIIGTYDKYPGFRTVINHLNTIPGYKLQQLEDWLELEPGVYGVMDDSKSITMYRTEQRSY